MQVCELIEALRVLSVETGSLACLGCGHEHNCSTHGCAIIRAAIEKLEELNNFDKTQSAKLLARIRELECEIKHLMRIANQRKWYWIGRNKEIKAQLNACYAEKYKLAVELATANEKLKSILD